jgi:hypothetical protein
MHIAYEKLTKEQDAKIKSLTDGFKAAKNKQQEGSFTVALAAYLNAHLLASSVICITCKAAEDAMKYAVAHYDSIPTIMIETTKPANKKKQKADAPKPEQDGEAII